MLVILEEGINPLLSCPKCDMFVTWKAINVRHQSTAVCARRGGADSKFTAGGRGKEELRKSMTVDFQDYRRPLVSVAEFK